MFINYLLSHKVEIAIAITVIFVSTLTFFLGYSIGRVTSSNKTNLSLKDDSSSADAPAIVQSKSGLSLKSYIESAASNDSSTSNPVTASAAGGGPLSVSSVRSNGFAQLSSPGRTSFTNSTLAISKKSASVDESSPSAASNRKYFAAATEKAKEMLLAMSGLPPGFVISRVWKSVYSDASTNANIWIEKTKKEKEGNSIMLRGTFFVPNRSASSSVSSIVKWLIEEDLLTAIEGLIYRSEVIEKIKNESELIVVRKMYCKSGIISTKREFIVVFGSGYIIRPSSIAGKSCEIFMGANIDLMGSKSVRMLTSKTDVLVCSSIRTMKRIQNGCADSFVPDQLMSPKRKKSPKSGSGKFDKDVESFVSEDDAQVDLTDPQKEELVVVSRQAIQKLRKLHSLIGFAIEDDESDHSAKKNAWELFYRDDIVTAIYPSAARDLLLVTSEEEYKKDKKGQAVDGGFVIASTSIDEFCEIKGGPGGKRLKFVDESSHVESSSSGLDNYSRTILKLAGYVATTREGAAGTDLTLILDLSQSYDLSTPGWLIQLLAQYGLLLRNFRKYSQIFNNEK
eukprot:gene30072-39266_t